MKKHTFDFESGEGSDQLEHQLILITGFIVQIIKAKVS